MLMVLIILILPSCGRGGSGDDWAGDTISLESVKVRLQKNPKALEEFDNKGLTLLHKAAKTGEKEIVEFLLAKGAQIDKGNRYNKCTALYYATAAGDMETVRLLVDKGADVDVVYGYGWTAASLALIKRYVEIAKFLISRSAGIKRGSVDAKMLMFKAVWNGAKELIPMLLEKGGDVNVRGDHGMTPLFYAVELGDLEMVRVLIANGADVNAAAYRGLTPLHFTAYWRIGRPEIARLLLENGAGVNTKTRDDGNTPLHFAAQYGFRRCAAVLLEKGASLILLNNMGHTPLGVAEWEGRKGIVRFLLSLHTAAEKGNPDKAESLLKKYPQLLNSRDIYGKTPLHYAADKNRLETAELLISRGADLNVLSAFKGIELLHGVVAKVLVPGGGRVKRVRDERTPLQFAVDKGYDQMARLLKEHGAE
jgi:ankyrin repeat protein